MTFAGGGQAGQQRASGGACSLAHRDELTFSPGRSACRTMHLGSEPAVVVSPARRLCGVPVGDILGHRHHETPDKQPPPDTAPRAQTDE